MTELKSLKGVLRLGVSGGDETLVFGGARSRDGLERIACGSGEPGCPWQWGFGASVSLLRLRLPRLKARSSSRGSTRKSSV